MNDLGPALLPRLVLASASPRRRELLAGLGLCFAVRPASVDETPRAGESAAALVERLAREKAGAVAGPGEVVVGADTVVALDGALLGKPADDGEAAAMLARLAGREHEVLTGIAVHDADNRRAAATVERSRVRFAAMSPRDVAWYVASGEPRDKAGAYAVQGRAALFVTAVLGNYSNVVGLPLPALRRLFGELGHDLLAWVPIASADPVTDIPAR
jgi:septum formation protein